MHCHIKSKIRFRARARAHARARFFRGNNYSDIFILGARAGARNTSQFYYDTN